MKISIIIPAYNEAENIHLTLQPLQGLREQGHEVIVVDGGSHDRTLELAGPLADHVFVGPKGRAAQMNAGAESAQHELLLFLHADTLLPSQFDVLLQRELARSQRQWGRFDVCLSGRHFMLRIVEQMMNWRSRITGIATGDQGIFVRRALFQQIDGYAAIPLMEDIDISKRLKKISPPLCIKEPLITSSRRWEVNGIYRTIFLMWRLRLAYFLGVNPDSLARRYL